MMERSIDLLVSLLGIMKCGATYLPIDADYPDMRIRHILEDSGAQYLVTRTTSVKKEAAMSIFQGRVINIADVNLVNQSKINPNVSIEPHDAAYIIYTSGSTGKPKGVVVEHQGLTNYICWAKKQYVNDEKLSFPLYTSLSFDLTVTSIFVPLVSGAKVLVYEETSDQRTPTILRVIQDKTAEVIKLTPAHLSLIKDLDMQNSRVKKLIVGGEDLRADLAKKIYNNFEGNVEIFNEYGPTEAVVGCMIHKYNPKNDIATSVPIGKPVDNVQIYLLDERQRPVPTGVIGEIYISGDSVARGYLNRTDLTSERFLDNPFVQGMRMYRTGDLGRRKQDGSMEYRGRSDQQVKIRGMRIELGEIEAELATFNGIKECIVHVTESKKSKNTTEPITHCVQCGLASNYPGTTFDSDGICNQCLAFGKYRKKVQPYFSDMRELEKMLTDFKARRTGDYDCMALLSGGKDSTYVMAKLVEMGLKVLGFTLDNGYISDQTKQNIKRVVRALNVDHVFGSTPHMNTIFVDSLQRHSNVCNGCFKTLYTLSINLAKEKGIPCIVTGLSQGQQFETRLSNFYRAENFCTEVIDRAIVDARKVYHRIDDEVSRRLDVKIFDNDDIFEQIRIVDFYRYTNVGLAEVYSYLESKLPWIRPSDTGRSTNCLINDVGIYVHQKERQYHNYAMPYAWDVRMGHKKRSEALEELDDDFDTDNVRQILREIGYEEGVQKGQLPEQSITAYYVCDNQPDVQELASYLTERLPEAMVPNNFVKLDALPLTINGKVDRNRLPTPERTSESNIEAFLAAGTPLEQQIVDIWEQVLGIKGIGIRENFFRIGGHSLLAAQVASMITREMNVELPISVLFEKVTIEELAQAVLDYQFNHYDVERGLENIFSEVESMSENEVSQNL